MPGERHRTRTATGTSETSADPREPLPLLRRELGTGDRGLSGREAARRLAVYGPNQVRRRAERSLTRLLTAQLPHPPALPLRRRDLGTGDRGLSGREAARRLAVYGPNQVRRRAERSLTRLLTAQLAHPLALLLWGAGALAFIAGTPALGWAILAVILVNAGFALLQEHQAERAVEALAAYLPERTHVIRDGRKQSVEAAGVVPGDLIVLAEGDKVPADARLTDGAVQVDLSMLTGESAPVERMAVPAEPHAPLLREPNLVFSGTTCVGGEAQAIVFATGGHTELGRIAALSQRAPRGDSPLERQVKKVAWLIAAVAV